MYVPAMSGHAGETEAVVAGFLAALAERAAPAPVPAPIRALPARILALAGEIEARHRARVDGSPAAEDLRAAAVVLAAYRLLAGALPASELCPLLGECWLRGLRRARVDGAWFDASDDPLVEVAAGSRWRAFAAMLFFIAGLPGLYVRLEARRATSTRFAAEQPIEQEFWRDFCAAEAVPELAPIFHAAERHEHRDRAANDHGRPRFGQDGA